MSHSLGTVEDMLLSLAGLQPSQLERTISWFDVFSKIRDMVDVV
jgi:hypothetical protein